MLWVALLALLLAGCGSSAKPPVKIGVQGPLTGQYAAEGQRFYQAVTLLSDQVNAEGGVLNGRPIEIMAMDDRADRSEAEGVARRLVDVGALAIIGSYTSDATEAAAHVYADAGMLHITPSATATRLSDPGHERFFRTCFTDDAQAVFAARLMAEVLDKRRVALVHDGTTYALGLAEGTRQHVAASSAEVVLFSRIQPGQRDFSNLLQQVRDVEADVMYFTAYYPEAALLVQQMHRTGVKETVQFVGGDAVNNEVFVTIAGAEAAAGSIVTTMPLPGDLAYAATERFIDQYRAEYGEAPGSIYTLTAADAFRLIVRAIEETGSDDPERWAAFLHEIEDFPGISWDGGRVQRTGRARGQHPRGLSGGRAGRVRVVGAVMLGYGAEGRGVRQA